MEKCDITAIQGRKKCKYKANKVGKSAETMLEQTIKNVVYYQRKDGVIMYRFAMNDLLQWKGKKNRKPLIIMGARQVGKTWLMKEFGKNCYEKTAYISFYNNQRMNAV